MCFLSILLYFVLKTDKHAYTHKEDFVPVIMAFDLLSESALQCFFLIMRASNNKLIVILFEKKLENEFVFFILKRNLSSRTMANGVRETFSANTGWDGIHSVLEYSKYF